MDKTPLETQYEAAIATAAAQLADSPACREYEHAIRMFEDLVRRGLAERRGNRLWRPARPAPRAGPIPQPPPQPLARRQANPRGPLPFPQIALPLRQGTISG